jgi:hypothetical protein
MALVYASASGNWSSSSLWLTGAGLPYGAVPTASDDVYANAKTITINQDFSVNRLSNVATGSAVAGGGFNCSIPATLTANTIQGTSGLLNFTCTNVTQSLISNIIYNATNATSAATVAITGNSGVVNITATSIRAENYQAAFAISNGAGSILNVTGTTSTAAGNSGNCIYNSTGILNFTGTVGAGQNTYIGIYQNGVNGVTNVYGTFLGSFSGNGRCVQADIGTINILTSFQLGPGSGYAVINGAATVNFGTPSNPIIISGSTAASSSLLNIIQSGNGLMNIYGNIVCQNYAPSATVGIVSNGSTSGILNIRGNINAGSVANTIAVNNSSTGFVIITGSIYGGTHATNTPAIYSTTAGTIDVSGSVNAGLFPAIFSTSQTATNRVRGNLVYSGSVTPVYAYNLRIDPTAGQSVTMQSTAGTSRILATSNISAGAPGTGNVRSGIVYGSTNELTGTLIVADPSNIRKGVPTDNTTGSADLTAADMWNYLASNLTTSGSIGQRMRNVATVDTVGSQIAAFTP